MMQCKAKSENLAHILGYQTGAVTLGAGLLPPHHGDGGEVVVEDGDHADSAPPEFPHSNLQLQVSVSWFLCFDGAPLWKTSAGLFL